MNDSKQDFFQPGDLVTLNKNLPNSPIMLVVKKEKALLKESGALRGFRCRWFTTNGALQEAVFNTKDLKLA